MQFQMLGPLEAWADGRQISLAGPRQRLVLAHLLLEANHVVPADRLIDRIWGDEPPRAARGSLWAYVSRLRKSLGSRRISAQSGGYVLHAGPEEIDAVRFEALVVEARRIAAVDPAAACDLLDEGLSLWRGGPLADLAAEPSVRASIVRLADLRISAVEDRIEARLATGAHAESLPELERLVDEHPLRERLWSQLMLALYRSGRQADAMEAYLRLHRRLADEIGVDPSPGLQRLQRKMLRQDSELDLIGRPLRGYRLLERIGEGPIGEVHRAVQPELQREVAVKAIHPRLASDPDFIRRFEQEAQLVARLEHPQVVPLYDYWRDPSGAYLAMRYLSGGSLDRLIQRGGAVAGEDAMVVIEQIALALDFAHRQGVVHGGVRPTNVLFDEDGNAYLSDFAVARPASSPAADEAQVDALAYVSPEQLRGEPARPSADLYSLGVMLHEMLGGHHSPGVDQIIQRATAVDPRARYTTALEMASALRMALSAPPGQTALSVAEAGNPYKGLRPFHEADASDFFGRDALTAALLARLREESPAARFLAVVGASGSGKSSAVRAGLIPAIRGGALPGSDRWFIVEMQPGAQPFVQLERVLLTIAAARLPRLRHELDRDSAGLLRVVDQVLPGDDSELLIVVDQFEELFTLTESEDHRRAFLTSLHEAVTTPASRVRLIVTLRADFYDRPLLYKAFGDLLAARTHVVTPLSTSELERAIVGPAERVGMTVEPRLIAEVVTDVAHQPAALPLLQYALTELFDHRQDDTLGLRAYQAVGGVLGALGQRAERIHSDLDRPAKEASRQLFLRLVTLTEDGMAETRRRVPQSELARLELKPGAIERVTELYGRHRLLTYDRDTLTREPTVEVAHEALIREWPTLRRWLDDDRDGLRIRRHLTEAAGEWDRTSGDPGALLRGARLAEMLEWSKMGSIQLNELERAFLDASRDAAAREDAEREERNRRDMEAAARIAAAERERAEVQAAAARRLRRRGVLLAGAASIGVVLAGVALLFGLRAEEHAQLANARELAASAIGVLDDDPELSILLALKAADVADPPSEAIKALHRAVQASRTICTARLDDDVPVGASVGADLTSDGSRLALTGNGAAVDVWDVDRCERLMSHGDAADGPESPSFARVAFSPDDRYVAGVAARDIEEGPNPMSVVRIWDTDDGTVRSFAVPGAGAGFALFSPDGRRLATVTGLPGDSLVIEWDLASASELARWNVAFPTDIRYHPDGRRLVVDDVFSSSVQLLDPRDGSQTVAIADVPSLQGASFSPDGTLIATGGLGQGYLFDAVSGDRLRVFPQQVYVRLAVFDFVGRRLATTTDDGTARIWDVATGALLMTLSGHEGNALSLDFADDGTRLLTATSDRTARVWDLTNARGGEVAGFDVGGSVTGFAQHGETVAALTRTGLFAPGPLVVIDMASGDRVEVPNQAGLLGGTVPESAVALSPDGGAVISQSVWVRDDGRLDGYGPVRVRELWSGEPVLELLEICPDSREPEACDEAPGVPFIESASTAAFSPDRRWIALGGYSRAVSLWSAVDGTLESIAPGIAATGGIGGVAFHPDGHLLAVAGGVGQTVVLGVPGLERVATLEMTNATDIQFSPSGSLLAAVSATERPKVFRTDDWSLVHELGIVGAGWSLDFSGDGGLLATGHTDGFIYVWDIESGRERQSIPAGGRDVASIAFVADDRHLLVGTEDGALRVLTRDTQELIAIARSRLTRTFTEEECRIYLHADICPDE